MMTEEKFTVVGFYVADDNETVEEPFVEHVTVSGNEYVGVKGAIRATAEAKMPQGDIEIVAVFRGHLENLSAGLPVVALVTEAAGCLTKDAVCPERRHHDQHLHCEPENCEQQTY
jgi:hypothetical protein